MLFSHSAFAPNLHTSVFDGVSLLVSALSRSRKEWKRYNQVYLQEDESTTTALFPFLMLADFCFFGERRCIEGNGLWELEGLAQNWEWECEIVIQSIRDLTSYVTSCGDRGLCYGELR